MRYGVLLSSTLGTGVIAYGLVTGHERLYKSLFMPAVRLVDPEHAHVLAVKFASWGMVPRDRSVPDKILVRIFLVIPVPIYKLLLII